MSKTAKTAKWMMKTDKWRGNGQRLVSKNKNLFSSPTSSLNFTFCDRMKRLKEHNEGFLFQIILKALPFMEREYFQKQFKLFSLKSRMKYIHIGTLVSLVLLLSGVFLSLNLIDNDSIIKKKKRKCLGKCSKEVDIINFCLLSSFIRPQKQVFLVQNQFWLKPFLVCFENGKWN